MLSEKEIHKMAVSSGFYKRKCHFTPTMFFDILLYCASQNQTYSLTQTSTRIKDLYRVMISKQSLDERYNPEAVEFVKKILRKALEKQLSSEFNNEFLQQFNQVRIKDSTRFNVPNKLSKHYKGSGGDKDTSQACVCIQYEYDLKSGRILDLNITSGIRNDAIDANATKENIEQNDLVLRDLGYFNLQVLSRFQKKGAYFISKLNASCSLFSLETSEKISFTALFKQMQKEKINRCEMMVMVGKTKKKILRLLVDIIPENVYEKRIRRMNKRNKENGYTTSDDYKARSRFNFFITNVTKDKLTHDQILLAYRLRWQIELNFKTWKSIGGIDKISSMKYERFTCLLVGKLILITLHQQIVNNLQRYLYKHTKKLLSFYKCFQTLTENFITFRNIIKQKKSESERNLSKLFELLSTNHWKEKRKGRRNLVEIIEILSCNSIFYTYI